MVLECEDGVVVAELDISLSTGANSPPLGLPEGSNGGLWLELKGVWSKVREERRVSV